MVADEAVYELAYRVDEQHGRTDQSELAGGKHASVNEGLLDHAETEAADIVKAVCRSRAPEGPASICHI